MALLIHTIALCLRTGALTVEYFRAHGFYEWLAITTGSYWSNEELKTLLGDLDRYECKPSQAQMNTVKSTSQYDAGLGVTSEASASGGTASRMTVHNSAFPTFAPI